MPPKPGQAWNPYLGEWVPFLCEALIPDHWSPPRYVPPGVTDIYIPHEMLPTIQGWDPLSIRQQRYSLRKTKARIHHIFDHWVEDRKRFYEKNNIPLPYDSGSALTPPPDVDDLTHPWATSKAKDYHDKVEKWKRARTRAIAQGKPVKPFDPWGKPLIKPPKTEPLSSSKPVKTKRKPRKAPAKTTKKRKSKR